MKKPQTIVVLIAMLTLFAPPALANPSCGSSLGDWCTSAKDGPCGRHMDMLSCRNDSACRGMTYTGESVVACRLDADGFALNCPTVGCLDR